MRHLPDREMFRSSVAMRIASIFRPDGNKAFTADAIEHMHQSGDFRPVRHKLSRILTENILGFWYPQVLDHTAGGYRLSCDRHGNWAQSSRKLLIEQARTLWFFARISSSDYAEEQYRKAADHGYAFLDNFLDNDNGGYYWEIDAVTRKPTRAGKHLCAQSFILFTLAEYSLSSNNTEAAERAARLFTLMDRHAHDSVNGGYRECFDEEWRELKADEAPYLGVSPLFKTFNTHIHLLEAVTAYYRMSRDLLAGARLVELLNILQDRMIDRNYGTCLNHFSGDWHPAPGDFNERVSYGHDLENLWLSMDARRVLGLPIDDLIPSFRRTFSYTLEYGYDCRHGGIYDYGPIGKRANGRAKVWWSQAEALVAGLEMYQLTKDMVYLDFFLNTLNWLTRYQIDWSAGEWHQRVYRFGRIKGAKAEAWKTPYHNGRAMIHCLELLHGIG